VTEPDQPTAAPPPPARQRESRPPARRRRRKLALGLAGAAICFALGVALGQALEDGRGDGRLVTRERTLHPVTVAPPPRTITVAP
jgi:hypothetical protein